MEIELLHSDNAGPLIRDIINQSCIGLVVLLGKNILDPPGSTPQFTHNWVGFEIGVAACACKPVVVFEDYYNPIDFPVPYLNHFVRYRLDGKHSKYFGQIVKENMPVQKYMAPDVIRCPNPNCNAVFYYWSVWIEMHCPVCREDFEVDEESDIKRGNRFDFMLSNIV